VTPTPQAPAEDNAPVPLRDVERELSRRLKAVQGPGDTHLFRAQMSNLVIYCNRTEVADAVEREVPAIVALHPARVLLLRAEPGPGEGGLTATVRVRVRSAQEGARACSEQVTLHARDQAVERLPFAVRGLLIGDLPTNLWWAASEPPPLAGPLLYELADHTEQIIYDSLGWLEPARAVAATAAWLATVERTTGPGPWRIVGDLNWRRLKYWRRLLAQALHPASAPGALESVTEVMLEHGPHAVIQAWQLASWLAARLGWQVQAGRVEPGRELTWNLRASHGLLRLRVRRLDEGPPNVRRLRVACLLDGKPGALNVVAEGDHRLAVAPEGVEGAARTVTVPPQPVAEIVARQLSDREPDPVFRESMAVAQVLAQSVLG
jgi:glucose-6-phosphate dehydrogenase assembly protein OpcA